eukprot:6189445-Pleurochrysis_carterae.AAC.1
MSTQLQLLARGAAVADDAQQRHRLRKQARARAGKHASTLAERARSAKPQSSGRDHNEPNAEPRLWALDSIAKLCPGQQRAERAKTALS